MRFRIDPLTRKPPAVAEPAIHGTAGTHQKNTAVGMPLKQNRGNGNAGFVERVLHTFVPLFHNGRYRLRPYRAQRIFGINKTHIEARYFKRMKRNHPFQGFDPLVKGKITGCFTKREKKREGIFLCTLLLAFRDRIATATPGSGLFCSVPRLPRCVPDRQVFLFHSSLSREVYRLRRD